MSDAIAGLDLGCVTDYTALAVLRRDRPGGKAHYTLSGLSRVRGLEYVGTAARPGVVERVRAYLGTEPGLRGCHMGVDRTGVGRAVVDAFRSAALPCVLWAVTVTAGHQVRTENLDVWVPKADLVGAAQMLLSSGRLTLDSRLPLAGTLEKELKNFTIKVSAAGNESFAASGREGVNDDLVFALGMACWLAERFPGGAIGTGHRKSPFAGAGFRGGRFAGKPAGGW